jgi:DNA polymerase I
LKCQLIIDADTIVYKAASAAQYEYEFEPDHWCMGADLKIAKSIIEGDLNKLMDRFKTKDIILCLTDKENWRTKYHSEYKRNRAKHRKPVGFVALKEWLQTSTNNRCIQRRGLEADDICGILATKPGKVKRIIVSVDKDLKTIPGWLYNPDRDDVPVRITEDEANWNLMYQVLVGDKTDNYQGCPGIGPVKAREILDKAGKNLWSAVLTTYINAGLTAEDAFANAAAARILRHGDLDTKTLELIWRPV